MSFRADVWSTAYKNYLPVFGFCSQKSREAKKIVKEKRFLEVKALPSPREKCQA